MSDVVNFCQFMSSGNEFLHADQTVTVHVLVPFFAFSTSFCYDLEPLRGFDGIKEKV